MAAFDQFVDVHTGEKYWATHHIATRYQLDDESTFPVTPCAAWCFDCRTVVAAEHLATESEMSKQQNDLQQIADGGESDLSFFFHRPEDAATELRNRTRLWRALKKRNSPARCLTCFGTSIIRLLRRTEEMMQIPDGPTLRYDSWGMADCGIEPDVVLNVNGEPVT